MSEQYFQAKPAVASDERDFSFILRGHTFSFNSDRGVFSKKEVDFGSRLLIESFNFPVQPGPLLDVGCGYGPIGLSLAKDSDERTVHMIDVNERALSLAKRNAERNNVKNVQIYESNCLENVSEDCFAAILTNPPIRAGKKVVFAIFEQAKQRLIKEGELWVVIQKKQGAPSALEKLKTLYSEVEVVQKKKGYFIIKAKK